MNTFLIAFDLTKNSYLAYAVAKKNGKEPDDNTNKIE